MRKAFPRQPDWSALIGARAPLLALLCTLGCPPLHASGSHPPMAQPIQVEGGKVLGVLTPDQQVIAYKGIPYAAPPVEDLRWRPPQPVGKWKKVLFAHDFGSHCIQFGSYPDMVFHDSGPSEDCLTLNVWAPVAPRPAKRGERGLPVMVWIYGGGFQTGGTSERRQDGEVLAHRGVIVVSMNYRLGLFGFMAHPELTTESPHHASGNYGLMDQAAALAWVGRNIAAFGGDPSNVTIFGESAGSMSVSALMASPAAKGMFARAIGESGGALYGSGPGYPARADAEAVATKWTEQAFGSSRLFLLRQLPTDELVQAATSKTRPAPHFGPDIDGYFLPQPVARIYASGDQAHVPLLGGWNSDENRQVALYARPPVTAQSFAAQAASEFGSAADQFLMLYPGATDAQALQSAGDFAGDRFIDFSTWAWLEAQTRTGQAPVYRYFFALGSPGDDNHAATLGAFHSDDIEYVFGALDSRPGVTVRPEDRKLSEQMQQYWTNFAKTGDPNGPGLPKWPVYGQAGGWQVLRLDATSSAGPDALRPRYLFLDGVWGKAARAAR